MFETKGSVFLIAGLFFFAIAFLGNVLVPIAMYRDMPEKQLPELVNPNVMIHFEDLSKRYPGQFKKYFGEPTEKNCEEALALGRKVYTGEACWHCHSQFVRPVSQEDKRFGPVSQGIEYQNVLQRPVLFGTRRVGPDLSRESNRRSNDWHAVHFHRPKDATTWSIMPAYPWFFDVDPATGKTSPNLPNKRGLAMITYMQWLGSWHPTWPYYEYYDPLLDSPRPGTLPIAPWSKDESTAPAGGK